MSSDLLYHSKNGYALLWKLIYIGVGATSIVINSLYLLDYYLAMRNPFYPRKRRAKWYKLAIVTVFIPLLFILVILEGGAQDIFLNLAIFEKD